MSKLRTQYLEAFKGSKTLISKSAIGPQLYAVRNGAGQVLGFYPGERISPEEVKRVISKSADLPEDPNNVFDDFRLFPTAQPEEQQFGQSQEIQKGAELDDDPNAELKSLFPSFLR